MLFINKKIWIWLDKELISCESKAKQNCTYTIGKKLYAIHSERGCATDTIHIFKMNNVWTRFNLFVFHLILLILFLMKKKTENRWRHYQCIQTIYTSEYRSECVNCQVIIIIENGGKCVYFKHIKRIVSIFPRRNSFILAERASSLIQTAQCERSHYTRQKHTSQLKYI